MKRQEDNGQADSLFSVRSKEDLEALNEWLSNRDYNEFTQDENFSDRHGKPIIGLRRTIEGGNPPARRGIVWFKNKELRKEGAPIIARCVKK